MENSSLFLKLLLKNQLSNDAHSCKNKWTFEQIKELDKQILLFINGRSVPIIRNFSSKVLWLNFNLSF